MTKDNSANLIDHLRFELICHHANFPLFIEVDEIFKLSCLYPSIQYQFDPAQASKWSVHGAINILWKAKCIEAKIFEASISEVFGDPIVYPRSEGYWGIVNPIGPRLCCNEGNRCVETLIIDYQRQQRLKHKIAYFDEIFKVP